MRKIKLKVEFIIAYFICTSRRAHLKECFDILKKEVPSLEDKKTSNLNILRSALKHIQVRGLLLIFLNRTSIGSIVSWDMVGNCSVCIIWIWIAIDFIEPIVQDANKFRQSKLCLRRVHIEHDKVKHMCLNIHLMYKVRVRDEILC